MLWRLPPSVRSLLISSPHRYSSTKTTGPLRILFCGSDEFSIKSLRALNDAKHARQDLVKSIDVVHRPGKRTGRGLKVVREVPIKRVATSELHLNTHEIDTFTGWTPPAPFDIVIAVSFGLLVPPRILNSAKYGGLNVHPSLLPDLRGPAPIHHTLLKWRPFTGVTVQTLHPTHFDQGLILAQTPPMGLPVSLDATPDFLIDRLGAMGGEMLVDVLESRAFVPDLEDVGWYAHAGGPIDHAEKITPAHRYVDFATVTALDILTRHRVLGDLWCKLPSGARLILNKMAFVDVVNTTHRGPGLFVHQEPNMVVARTADGRLLLIQSCTVAGGKKGQGNATVQHILKASK